MPPQNKNIQTTRIPSKVGDRIPKTHLWYQKEKFDYKNYTKLKGKVIGYFDDEQLKYTVSFDWLRSAFDKWNDLPNFSDTSINTLKTNYTARIVQQLAYSSCREAAIQLYNAILWYNKNSYLCKK